MANDAAILRVLNFFVPISLRRFCTILACIPSAERIADQQCCDASTLGHLAFSGAVCILESLPLIAVACR